MQIYGPWDVFLLKPLFEVDEDASEYDQVASVFNVLGMPNYEDIKYLQTLPFYEGFMEQYLKSEQVIPEIREQISSLRYPQKDLLMKFLQYNPNNRISIDVAVNRKFN